MSKIVSIDEAVNLIKDGMSVMVGGFMGCGSPHKLIQALLKKGTKNLTLICNDGGFPEYGIGYLIVNKQVKKLIASHIGLNPEAGKQMTEKTMDVELVPQGTLAERIRCGGNGLGGILTPTGVGTIVEEGKQKITVNDIVYILEKPIHADIALLSGYKVDKKGNIWYRGNARNFNVPMATAADIVIVEADNVVEIGEIEPENVVTPGIFVTHIVDGGKA